MQELKNWWNGLEPQWQKAFGEVFFGHFKTPVEEELNLLHHTMALRLAGPLAPYPNMSFELTNLSGIASLTQLQILVVSHHQIEELTPLALLSALKSVFLFNNKIKSLNGMEGLPGIEQLYVQYNKIESLLPLNNLVHLKELYVHDNLLQSLEGITEQHATALEHFFCKPNTAIPRKEFITMERELGILCRGI